jgi:hypothetical protein
MPTLPISCKGAARTMDFGCVQIKGAVLKLFSGVRSAVRSAKKTD